MSEGRFWLWFWTIVIIGVVSFSGIIATYNYNVKKMYVEKGYERGVVTTPGGYSSIEWVKK